MTEGLSATLTPEPDCPALLDRTGLSQVATLADIGGRAPDVTCAAWQRWGCDILLVDLDGKGRWCDTPSAPVTALQARLVALGMPPDRIHRIAAPAGLRPVDLVLNLGFFGDAHKIKHIELVLPAVLHAQSRMLTDIRKGSGAFPLLNGYGRADILTEQTEDAITRSRVLYHAKPDTVPRPPAVAPAAAPAEATSPEPPSDWATIAASLCGPDGFFRDDGNHSFLFVPRSDTLVVTFDNVELAMEKRDDRRPWGYSFIEKQGWSMLGVMANGWTWYRDPWVAAQFDDLRDSGFFARFRRVVFYGASMGGYAAAAYVGACPGADAVIISPQSTLDRSVVPWETRYKTAWDRDFSGPYGDAATASHAAGTVTLLYDPYEELDAAHAARFTGPNVLKLRAPLLGHRLGSSLQQMGILAPVTLGALNGTLTEAEFYRLLRLRKTFSRYQKELFDRALAMGRPALARKVGRWVLTRGDNRHIRREMLALDQATAAKTVPA